MDHDEERLPIIQQSSHETSPITDPSPPTISSSRPPIWTWFLLAASILAVSSAGAIFETMSEVPSLLLSSWRLQATSIILIAAALVQWQNTPHNIKQDTINNYKLLAISGTSLALHFFTWVSSLKHTSLTHSLLFVCSTPLLLAAITFIRGLSISIGEISGTLLGFVGTLVLASSASSEKEVTLLGDAFALTASAAFIPYLLIGKYLRKWMPLFIYASAVTFLAAVELAGASMVAEGSFFFGKESMLSTFGWLTDLRYFLRIVYLGIVPGLIGHTGINLLLKYLNPLVITLTLNLEPLLGSVLGYLMMVSPPPGIVTYVGGFIILLSTGIVSVATQHREDREMHNKEIAATDVVNVAVQMASLSRQERMQEKLKHKDSGLDIHGDGITAD